MDMNRKTAYYTLLEIERSGAYSNIELNKQIEINQPESPAFVRELVYGVVENKIYLDYLLSKLITRGLKGVKKPVLTLLRMGLYQLIFMDSVPQYAAVNEMVKLARRIAPGRDGFVNGVLRGYTKLEEEIPLPSRDKAPIEYLSVRYSYESWIVKLWIEQYGLEQAEAMLKACNTTPLLSIRVNMGKIQPSDLKQRLEGKGFNVKEGSLSKRALFVSGGGLLSTEEYREGLFSVQDESSILCAETLNPGPEDLVLDLCAAPGGKTLAMAEIMGNRGLIKAYDYYEHKLGLIEREAKRLGLENIQIAQQDATVYNEELAESADKVMVDGPCSGLGVIRRKPEIKYKELDDNGRGLAEKQLLILENACRYVKAGGEMVYSTCTVNKIENEDVVNEFLKRHGEFKLISERQLIPGIDETDGFYICKLKRSE